VAHSSNFAPLVAGKEEGLFDVVIVNDSLEDVGGRLAALSDQLQHAGGLADGHEQSLRQLAERQRAQDNRTAGGIERLEARLDESERSIDRVTGNMSFTTQLLGSINLNLNGLRGCAETVGRHSDLLLILNLSVADVRTDAAALRARQEDLAARLDTEVTNLSIIMEEMKLVDSKHSQIITNLTILQGESCCPLIKPGLVKLGSLA